MRYFYYHFALNSKIVLFFLWILRFRKMCLFLCGIFLAIFFLNSTPPFLLSPFSLMFPFWTPTCIFSLFLFIFNVKHWFYSFFESSIISSLYDINFPVCFICHFLSSESFLMPFIFFYCELIFNGVFSPFWVFMVFVVVESGFAFSSSETLWVLLTQAIKKHYWLVIPALHLTCIISDSTPTYDTSL